MKSTSAAQSSAERPAAKAGEFVIGGDLRVHRLGFGAMRITGKGIWGEPKDRGEAVRVLRKAVELGIDFIDTADSYGPAVSEEIIAEALYPYPKELVIRRPDWSGRDRINGCRTASRHTCARLAKGACGGCTWSA